MGWSGVATAAATTVSRMCAAPMYFAYDQTAVSEFPGVYRAPAGTTKWSPNQALNDDDKALDFGERLTLTGLPLAFTT